MKFLSIMTAYIFVVTTSLYYFPSVLVDSLLSIGYDARDAIGFTMVTSLVVSLFYLFGLFIIVFKKQEGKV
jgi:hypothetical protein